MARQAVPLLFHIRLAPVARKKPLRTTMPPSDPGAVARIAALAGCPLASGAKAASRPPGAGLAAMGPTPL